MGFLLTSLGFPGPITLFLSLGFMGLPQTPYSFSLHCLGPTVALSHFSTSYIAHGMLFLSFLASLSLLASSRPIYLFSPEFRSYPTRTRKFQKQKKTKKIQKIKKHHSCIISIETGMDRPRKREKNLCLEIRSYSNRARKSKKKKSKKFQKN